MLFAFASALNYLTESFLPWMESDAAKSFCSLQFLTFAVTIFAIYWSLPWNRARVWLLILASFGFYATWSEQLAFIVLVSATLGSTTRRKAYDFLNRIPRAR